MNKKKNDTKKTVKTPVKLKEKKLEGGLAALTKKVKETKAKESFMDKDSPEDALKQWEDDLA